ncbi:cytochrome c oxidase assembly protein [Vibrio algicola]|uniref:Cytochrome c oxidase assembly protein CtaG n=1 Tax=Vibrio algicola TaxID=2662262 RepID=A0A5Q0THQ0_9VIBR|nr:cytochrome c oxidase assembly protein [Vibrio algicola]
MANNDLKHGKQGLNQKRLISYLLLGVIGMFAFGFALVPLYDIMCDKLGINGKTNTVAASSQGLTIDTSRKVLVQFISNVSPSIPWTFRPNQTEIFVHPGQVIKTTYHAVNNGNKAMIGQAVPSISPGLAATHFNKIECFCFNHQPLGAHAVAELPVIFYVDHQLPQSINTLTLSYTLYDITDKQKVTTEITKKPVVEDVIDIVVSKGDRQVVRNVFNVAQN